MSGLAPNPLAINAETGEPWEGKLVAYWRLSDADDIQDLSGNGHHLTMEGTLTTFASHPPVAPVDTAQLSVTATINEWLSLQVEPNTLNLGDLVDTGGNTFIGTATSTLTLGTNNESGWTVDIRSANAALVHSSGTSTGQILSATSTVAAGEDHYGVQCASGDATCAASYDKSSNDVKGLLDTDELFASTGAPGSLQEVLLTVKAAADVGKAPGTYSDTITLTALPGV